MKRKVAHLERWTANPYTGGRSNISMTGPNQRVCDGELPIHAHPLVRTHPGTGRKSLYVSAFTSGIRGIHGPGASWRASRLLRRLQRHVNRPHLYHTHRWQPGDLVISDNHFTNHKRVAFDAAARRVLYRCQVVGARPV